MNRTGNVLESAVVCAFVLVAEPKARRPSSIRATAGGPAAIHVRHGRGHRVHAAARGGVHIPLDERWGLSAQVDYRPVFYREDTVNEVRFVIGARWTGR